MVLQPGSLIRRHPKGKGMGFWEHIQTIELSKDFFRYGITDTPYPSTFQKHLVVLLDKLLVMPPTEGATHLVGLLGLNPATSMASWLT